MMTVARYGIDIDIDILGSLSNSPSGDGQRGDIQVLVWSLAVPVLRGRCIVLLFCRSCAPARVSSSLRRALTSPVLASGAIEHITVVECFTRPGHSVELEA